MKIKIFSLRQCRGSDSSCECKLRAQFQNKFNKAKDEDSKFKTVMILQKIKPIRNTSKKSLKHQITWFKLSSTYWL